MLLSQCYQRCEAALLIAGDARARHPLQRAHVQRTDECGHQVRAVPPGAGRVPRHARCGQFLWHSVACVAREERFVGVGGCAGLEAWGAGPLLVAALRTRRVAARLALMIRVCASLQGCPANVVTFNTLCDVYGKSGQWEEALAGQSPCSDSLQLYAALRKLRLSPPCHCSRLLPDGWSSVWCWCPASLLLSAAACRSSVPTAPCCLICALFAVCPCCSVGGDAAGAGAASHPHLQHNHDRVQHLGAVAGGRGGCVVPCCKAAATSRH